MDNGFGVGVVVQSPVRTPAVSSRKVNGSAEADPFWERARSNDWRSLKNCFCNRRNMIIVEMYAIIHLHKTHA